MRGGFAQFLMEHHCAMLTEYEKMMALEAASARKEGKAAGGTESADVDMGGKDESLEEGGKDGVIGNFNDAVRGLLDGMIWAHPESCLLDSALLLLFHNIHNLPIMDPDQSAVLAVLDFRTLLEYMAREMTETRR